MTNPMNSKDCGYTSRVDVLSKPISKNRNNGSEWFVIHAEDFAVQ
jgi:hypothetical protein